MTNNNLWLGMWIRPRRTIRQIVQTNTSHRVTLLAAASGVATTLERGTERGAASDTRLGFILFIILVLGPFFGLVTLYVSGSLLRWSVKLIGGQAEVDEVRAALAWSSSVRTISITLLLIPSLLLFGQEVFYRETPLFDTRVQGNPQFALWSTISIVIIAAASIILGLWYIIVFLKALGEVHEFSAWKALFASIIGYGVIIVPLVLLILLLFASS